MISLIKRTVVLFLVSCLSFIPIGLQASDEVSFRGGERWQDRQDLGEDRRGDRTDIHDEREGDRMDVQQDREEDRDDQRDDRDDMRDDRRGLR